MTRTTAALLAAILTFLAALTFLPSPSRALHRLISTAYPIRPAAATGFPTVGIEGRAKSVIERRRLLSVGSADLARTTRQRLALVAGVVALILGITASLGPDLLFSLGALALIAGVVLSQRSRQRRRNAAASRRSQVIEACDVLAADLSAGRPPRDALEGAALICADLQIAAAAAKLGGEVAGALDLAAESPGAEGLRALGASWRVADESGAAFATIVQRLADSLRADETLRRHVAANLAGTRSTARLLAGLPLFGTALGYAIGANPIAFLTGTPLGWLCLTLGLALATLGLLWTDRLSTPPH